MKSMGLVAYLVHVRRLNFAEYFRRLAIENKHTLVRFLRIAKGCSTLDDEMRGQNERSSRNWCIGLEFVEMEGVFHAMTDSKVRKINLECAS